MDSDNLTLLYVIADLRDRADVGFKKYGEYLHQNNRDSMLQHAYEEALDLAMYLKAEIRRNKAKEDAFRSSTKRSENVCNMA